MNKYSVEFIENKILTDDLWLIRAILALYKKQTNEEQSKNISVVRNNMGFNKPDSYYFSSIAKIILCMYGYKKPTMFYDGFLSKNQLYKCRILIRKYVKQLTLIANSN